LLLLKIQKIRYTVKKDLEILQDSAHKFELKKSRTKFTSTRNLKSINYGNQIKGVTQEPNPLFKIPSNDSIVKPSKKKQNKITDFFGAKPTAYSTAAGAGKTKKSSQLSITEPKTKKAKSDRPKITYDDLDYGVRRGRIREELDYEQDKIKVGKRSKSKSGKNRTLDDMSDESDYEKKKFKRGKRKSQVADASKEDKGLEKVPFFLLIASPAL
jgi:hypothetical protein